MPAKQNIYGWDTANWKPIITDLAGHLQVDVITAGGTAAHCMGYDGAAWQTLLVESAAQKNLRVKIYDGANGISSSVTNGAAMSATARGLVTRSQIVAWATASSAALRAAYPADAFTNLGHRLWVLSFLMGFNGATWDRLRTYGTGVLKVGRAEIDSTTVRKTAAGAVVAGARKLFWIACSPDAPGGEWELTDAIAGGGAVVYDHFDVDKHSEHLVFDPPMKFTTGIWIEKFDHMHSLVFCYI